MKIITHPCPNCGTIVAANELERRRVMKCPGLDCNEIHHFEDLSQENQEHFLENRDRYEI